MNTENQADCRTFLAGLTPGSHLCILYQSEGEKAALLEAYLNTAFANNKKVIYIVDPDDVGTISCLLTDAGVDIEINRHSGSLRILTATEIYLKECALDPEAMIAWLKMETRTAVKEGFSGLQVTGEMTWALREGFAQEDRLLEYEAKLDRFLLGSDCVALCQYDRRCFRPEMLLNALKTHPIAVVGSRVYDNMYYIPPARVPNEDEAGARLAQCLKNLERNRRTDAALHRQLDVMQQVIDCVPEPLFYKELNGRYFGGNQAFKVFMGIEGRDMFDSRDAEMLSPENAARLKSLQKRAMETESPVYTKETLLTHADGSRRKMLVRIAKLKTTGDHAKIFVSTLSDVTDKNEAMARLDESLRTTRALIDHSPMDAIFMIDRNGILLEANETLAKRFQKRREEMIGQSTFDLIPPELAVQRRPMLEAVWREGEARHFVDQRDGLWIDNMLFPIRNKDGQIFSLGVIARDITHQKKADLQVAASEARYRKALKEGERKLYQSQKLEAVGNLAAGVAHDFNNILGAILGNAEISLEEAPSESLIEDCLTDIINAAWRARDLVQQLLNFSRKADFHKEELMISPLVKECTRVIQASLPPTIRLKQRLRNSKSMILGDPSQVQQVLINLCNNASHAMGRRGGVLKIELDDAVFPKRPQEVSKKGICLTVKDTGEGIPEEVLSRIFEPYFATRKGDVGSGLGLAAVYGIVKDHGGEIRVESSPGKGTCFNVYFPVLERQEIAPPEKISSGSMPKLNILVVEAEAMLLRTYLRLFHALGHQVTGCSKPEEALEAFKQATPVFDLVMTNLAMPGMMGDALAREMLAQRPGLPIIFCTGYGEAIQREALKQLGIHWLLEKPVKMETLLRVLNEIIT